VRHGRVHNTVSLYPRVPPFTLRTPAGCVEHTYTYMYVIGYCIAYTVVFFEYILAKCCFECRYAFNGALAAGYDLWSSTSLLRLHFLTFQKIPAYRWQLSLGAMAQLQQPRHLRSSPLMWPQLLYNPPLVALLLLLRRVCWRQLPAARSRAGGRTFADGGIGQPASSASPLLSNAMHREKFCEGLH
jgi:hypothetical protein